MGSKKMMENPYTEIPVHDFLAKLPLSSKSIGILLGEGTKLLPLIHQHQTVLPLSTTLKIKSPASSSSSSLKDNDNDTNNNSSATSGGSITLVTWNEEEEQQSNTKTTTTLPSSMEILQVIPFPTAFKEGRNSISIDINFDPNQTIKISPTNSL